MPRKRVSYSLPPLPEIFPNFAGLPEESSRQIALIQILRRAAKKLQKSQAQPFYSLRQINSFFGVPLRTAAIAYEALEQEGLFTRIRSSQTLLSGKVNSLRKPVRAVVGIPIWMRTIIASPQSWEFQRQLEEELRKSGFVADTIFFHDEEENENEVLERLLRHQLNHIIWRAPAEVLTFSSLFLSLKDRGVRQIVIQGSPRFPCPFYVHDWTTAFREMAAAWKAKGILRAIILKPSHRSLRRGVKYLTDIMGNHGIAVEILDPDVKKLHQLVTAGKGRRTAIAFTNLDDTYGICNEEPILFEEILHRSLVAFCRGPVRIPYFESRSGKIDIVYVSVQERVQRIVSDLCLGHLNRNGLIHTFRAKYQPEVDLSAANSLL